MEDVFFENDAQTPVLSVHEACAFARVCEEAGDYEKACEYLRPWWVAGQEPRLANLQTKEIAELLLRSGTLAGCLGGNKRSAQQKKAQSWISQSALLFEILRDTQRVAECRLELGNCYFREGLLEFAEDNYRLALAALELPASKELYIVALIRRAIVERQSSRLWEARNTLEAAARLMGGKGSAFLQGRFFNEYATTLKNLGQAEKDPELIREATAYFSQAIQCFEVSGNVRYCAAVLNNLGGLLAGLGQHEEAAWEFNQARKYFAKLKDFVRAAQVDESRAQLFIKLKRYDEGAQIIADAVRILRASGEEIFLAEALITQGLIYARQERWMEARYACSEALRLAEHCADFESAGRAALVLLEEMCERLNADERREMLARAQRLLALTQRGEIHERLHNCVRRVDAATETERRQRDQEIQHDKMAALGQLAFGVAHDFNNILTTIKGRAQLMQRLELPQPANNSLQSIVQAVQDSSSLIKRIQDFGRLRPVQELVRLEMGPLLAEVVDMAQLRCAETNISLSLEPFTPAFVIGDVVELKEVFVNLIYNAVDALQNGGTITLAARQHEKNLEIYVRDTGQGMSPQIKAHIFEPFFSTKGKQGTGMGLAVSYSIVRRHDGLIEVDSLEGFGTTFKITLPLASRPGQVKPELPPRFAPAYHQVLQLETVTV